MHEKPLVGMTDRRVLALTSRDLRAPLPSSILRIAWAMRMLQRQWLPCRLYNDEQLHCAFG